MKINVFKAHPSYPVGPHEVGEARGRYLIQTGFAEAEKAKTDAEKAISNIGQVAKTTPLAPKKTAAKKETKAAPKKAATKME